MATGVDEYDGNNNERMLMMRHEMAISSINELAQTICKLYKDIDIKHSKSF